jgi:membrane protein implicated in regulation of membrane protease activity
MSEWLPDQIEYWYWWGLGLALLVIEILAPGFFFLWLGLAAGVVGVLVALFPHLTWQVQLIAFGTLSVLAVVAWWQWVKRHPSPNERPTLNRRGEQYLGRIFTLEQPIVNGYGFIHVDDTRWRVMGQDLPAGSRVRVVAVDGVLLKVEPV